MERMEELAKKIILALEDRKKRDVVYHGTISLFQAEDYSGVLDSFREMMLKNRRYTIHLLGVKLVSELMEYWVEKDLKETGVEVEHCGSCNGSGVSRSGRVDDQCVDCGGTGEELDAEL